jgi:hypothetical protein
MGAYRLVDCSGSLPDIYTDSVYTPTIDTYEGKIIYTQQYPNTCWEVIKDVAPTPETLGILFSFDLCPDCLDTLDTQCGCPTGYTYNTITQLCESSTSVCPEGYTYNASSGLCEAPSEPCELDLVIAIDRSSSISSTEMPLYKSFIREIIDAIQDDGNTNRITTDQVRVGIVYWGTSSPLTGVETAGNSNLDLQIGSSTTWQSGLASGSLKLKISSMAPVGPGTSYNGQGTNYFAGLRAAYQVITGTNSRPLANKRILWITDGWPNTSNPPVTINGITQPNHLSDNACTIPSITGVNSNPAPLNICHGPSDVAGGSNTSPYSIAKKLVYEQAMDLAQDI